MSPLRNTTQKIEHKINHQHAIEVHEHRDTLATILRAAAVVLLLLLFLHAHGWAQGIKPTGQNAQHVVCDSGCGSPPATADGSTFTAGTTDVSPTAGVYDDTIANLTQGTYGAPRLTNNRLLMVDCASGCSASGGFADNSSFTVGTTPITNLGAYFTSGADPALTTGNAARLRMDLHSYLLTTLGSPLPAGTNVIGHVIADSGSTTAVTSLPALPAGANLIGKVGFDQTTPGTTNAVAATNFPTTVDTNSGNKSANTLRVVLATDQTQLTNALKVDPSAVTSPISAVSLPLPANAAQETGGNLATIVTNTGNIPGTSSRCTLVSAASTNATNCKNGAGTVYGFRFVNTTTTVYYLRMYNLTTSPTCSSATGFIESIPIPPAGAAGQAGGIVAMETFGEAYSAGIGFCFTGGSSSTDNTNAATGVFGTILYR